MCLRRLLAVVALGLLPLHALGDQLAIPAAGDATIYSESPDLANGSGENFFAGRVNGVPVRRALLRFDLSSIPYGSTIDSVSLSLYMNRSKNSSDDTSLHVVTSDWSEGPSNPEAEEGGGTAALSGDATWAYVSYNASSPPSSPAWVSPGGDFDPSPSATTIVGATNAYYIWSTPQMAADAQVWLDVPSANFGWIVVGNEASKQSATRFASRSNNDLNRRPVLTVNFTPPAATGACDLPDGSCVVDTEGNCLANGGTYLGDGALCPDATGACCLPDGSCLTDTEGNCLAAGGVYQGDASDCGSVNCPLILEPFVDALTVPPVAQPVLGTIGGEATYDIAMIQTTQQVHRDLPPTTVWAYNGAWPGPTIVARRDQQVTVNWINDLRDELGNLRTDHYLGVDLCPHGAEDLPKTVVHLHGGHVPAEFDGHPEATFLPGGSATYVYPNDQQASLIWYHDHALGLTRLNVMMGLAGGYIIRDDAEDALNLPSGPYEVPLVIQDRTFNPDGSLSYPSTWGQMFLGEYNVVNGTVTPYHEVEQATYRFRIINGCNTRTYTLAFEDGRPFDLIGVDGGLLETPRTLSEITLASAERADILVTFTAQDAGQSVRLVNSAPAPFPGTPGVGVLPNVLEFRVSNTVGPAYTTPALLAEVPATPESESVIDRSFELNRFSDPCTGSVWMINGMMWDDITEFPVLGTTEVWEFVNPTDMLHPMHMHLVFFQVLDRTPIDENGLEVGPPTPPRPTELGWKDTVRVEPREKVRVIATFEDYAGLFPYHCHILEHEDHEMMRQFQTVCPADTNRDGFLDNGDITAFIALFLGGDPAADINHDGFLDNGDIAAFIAAFLGGC